MFDFLIPFHPKIVHFPIALFTGALILEILGRCLHKNILSQTALIMYVFAAVFTPVVIYSGLMEQNRLHLHHPVLTRHKNFAFLTMWIALGSLPVLWFLQKSSSKAFKSVFLAFLLVITVTVTIAAHFGGDMVYEYSVGVK